MPVEIERLVLWFPIVFMLHDFEELLLFEPWLKKNAGSILERVHGRVPPWAEAQLHTVLHKSTLQFAFPIGLIFALTAAASFLAVQFHFYPLFLTASSLFFLHGFLHLGQAAALRRYVPSLLTSGLLVLPYGGLLFARLLAAGVVTLPTLLLYFLAAAVLAGPLLLGMHRLGEGLYGWAARRWAG